MKFLCIKEKSIKRRKHEKISLALSFSLIASLSRAEDDGFYTSVGYQIGEAVQKVKNTGALQNL
ncbi:hypothetical protein C2S36_03630, partial [Helicobacter pylori]|uniref:hypothetical protein n=1 Tax=Helicobacter pylori TaxID=210 RepID=UPI000D4E241C